MTPDIEAKSAADSLIKHCYVHWLESNFPDYTWDGTNEKPPSIRYLIVGQTYSNGDNQVTLNNTAPVKEFTTQPAPTASLGDPLCRHIPVKQGNAVKPAQHTSLKAIETTQHALTASLGDFRHHIPVKEGAVKQAQPTPPKASTAQPVKPVHNNMKNDISYVNFKPVKTASLVEPLVGQHIPVKRASAVQPASVRVGEAVKPFPCKPIDTVIVNRQASTPISKEFLQESSRQEDTHQQCNLLLLPPSAFLKHQEDRPSQKMPNEDQSCQIPDEAHNRQMTDEEIKPSKVVIPPRLHHLLLLPPAAFLKHHPENVQPPNRTDILPSETQDMACLQEKNHLHF